MNEDKISGGLADDKTLGDVAKKHNVELDELKIEFNKGLKVEMEHTDDESVAREIAKDHLMEDPKYYTKLKTVEESNFPMIRRKLQEAASTIEVVDETPKSTLYFIFDGDRPIGGIELSNVSGSEMDDEATILQISGEKKERPIKVIRDAIPLLFRTIPTMNKLFVPTNPHNRMFWERAGATRFKDGIHVFQRGH